MFEEENKNEERILGILSGIEIDLEEPKSLEELEEKNRKELIKKIENGEINSLIL